MLTPDDVHHHRAPDVLAQRGRTLQAAWALHPERFVHGTPKPAPLPEAVWINPPATSTTGETSQYIETVGVSKSLTGSGSARPSSISLYPKIVDPSFQIFEFECFDNSSDRHGRSSFSLSAIQLFLVSFQFDKQGRSLLCPMAW